MFYKLIEQKRNEWLASQQCTVRSLIDHIIQQGFMRDAQLEAIKTYLYLKLECGNKPLWQLFVQGKFNSIDISQLELTDSTRKFLNQNKAAVALLEYAMLRDRKGKQLAPELEKYIKRHPEQIDYFAVFRKIFYGVRYTDYLFSLPMGAGKTYLMAAFIYIDLYFALLEPDNPCFAHNFIVLAPSGLKSSIVPSLKHIKEFNPAWVIPEPSASQLRKMIMFEVLDEQKSANKSNRLKNPNAQKINNHQPLDELIGLVAITNAEKVILDRVDKEVDPTLFSEEELNRIKLANELRETIGRIPQLSIFIDEVHHAADGEIKLRQVVNHWALSGSVNSILGFSGTPYLEKAEKVSVGDALSISNADLSNVVYYYPLIDGIGNFLKVPEVKFSDRDSVSILRDGVTEFLKKYRNTVYSGGLCAKLAIYCGQIENLETTVYPLCAEIAESFGLNPAEVILKYHEGNKLFPKPEGAETEFASLDTGLSKVKIILLVQIGKEGWDCKSLTGVVLSQQGVCPTNMVLQTSCRCLRQVEKGKTETALIWLNKFNADKLNAQLMQQQNIGLQEFSHKEVKPTVSIERFSRMDKQKVPPIDFYQLKISYSTLVIDEECHTRERLAESCLDERHLPLIHQIDFEGNEVATEMAQVAEGEEIAFFEWLNEIAKESFGSLTVNSLQEYETELLSLFDKITVEEYGVRYYNERYNQQQIRAQVRKAFVPQRDFVIKEEIIPTKARLLQIERLTSPIEVADDSRFYPDQTTVRDIVKYDEKADDPVSPEVQKAIELLEAQGLDTSALKAKDKFPERNQTFHYLPYRFDSPLELKYLENALSVIHGKPLEIYFNGDDTLTEFVIDCFRKSGKQWQYIGKYVPDFLIIGRDDSGAIHKVIIVETKGEGFAAKFAERRAFMQEQFIRQNNEKFGYERFRFLYIEDTMELEERKRMTLKAIEEFFKL